MPKSFPTPDSVGAGAAVIGRHVPSRPRRLQAWSGSVHAVSQQTESTQFKDWQSVPLIQAAPFWPGCVLVAVAVCVRVEVGVPVGVAVPVFAAVPVGEAVGVWVGVFVGDPVEVALPLGVAVGVLVGVSVDVPVGVIVAAAVPVGVPVGVSVGVLVIGPACARAAVSSRTASASHPVRRVSARRTHGAKDTRGADVATAATTDNPPSHRQCIMA
jgi:hypothetical protein